jgi:hypothetical protein
MKPWLHAKSSARKYGGDPNDYMDIHEFFDSSKAAHASVKHRAILHSAFGIFLAERVFGRVRTNKAGREYSVRDVGEQHVIEDLGFIPSVDDYLEEMNLAPWMGGPSRKTRTVDLTEPDEDEPAAPAVPDVPDPDKSIVFDGAVRHRPNYVD